MIETAADPGEVLLENMTITNLNENEKEFFIYKRDIKGVGGGNVPIFAEEGIEKTGFEVTEWVSFEQNSFVLGAGESIDFPVTITIPKDATPGSHFGGIFVSVEPPKLREIGAGVGYEVASILSIRIAGDVIDAARIRSFSTNKLFYGTKNVDFIAQIENQGNILIRPRGPITITNMFGGKPEIFTVNDNLAGVFPGATRALEFSWDDGGLGFGRYEAILALVYYGDKGQKTIDSSLIFWIFPMKIILPILIGFVVLILAGYIFTRMYVRGIVSRTSYGRHIAPQRYRKQVGMSRFMFVTITLFVVLTLFAIILFVFLA